MQFALPLMALLVGSSTALPMFSSLLPTRSTLQPRNNDHNLLSPTINLDPTISPSTSMGCIEMLKTLCVGIAVCNPVTVTNGNGNTVTNGGR